MPIAELVALIKLKGGKESVATMQGLIKSTIGAKVALGAAATALYQMSKAARDMAVTLDMYQLNTGLSGQQLQKLSYQAAQAGVSMGELGNTIQHLQNLSAKANLGEGWSPVLSRFGIMPGQDPVTQLNKIGAALRRMQSYAPGEARQLAHEVGLSDTMYYALLKGGTDEMNKQFLLTLKEQNALVKLNIQWNRFWFYIKQITVKIQALGAGMQMKFVNVLVNAVQGAGELLTRFVSLVETNKELKYIIAGILLYFNPWLAILAAIGLILEDIFVYFQGGDSITGKIVEWCKQSQKMQDIWLGIKTVFDVIKMSLEGLKMLWDEFVSPMIEKLSKMKWLTDIVSKISSFMNPLESLGQARRMYDQTIGSDNTSRPNIANNMGGDVNVTTTVNMNGTANTKEDGRTIAETVSGQVQEATRQNSYLPQAGGGLKYEPSIG